MTSAKASSTKTIGHENEDHFAELIGGVVVGDGQEKTDVIDQQGNSHSVKGGNQWQIFLYGRDRFVTNTEFQGIGNVAELMIACLDAFPEDRGDYLIDKRYFKKQLQEPMRELCAEIRKPGIFPELLSKAFFNGDEVDYFSVLPPNIDRKLPAHEKCFHVFSADDLIDIFSTRLEIANSRKIKRTDMAAQKVIFRYRRLNIAEIEVRNDSKQNYRLMKCRFQPLRAFPMLDVLERFSLNENIYVRGSARDTFSLD